MLCEMILHTKDVNLGDSTKNQTAGDAIIIKTEAQIVEKYAELLDKGLLIQETIDQYTDIKKPVKQITAADLQIANLRWPWGKMERKLFVVVQMDLAEKEIGGLGKPAGILVTAGDGFKFVQTAYRKSQLDYTALTALLDKTKIDDPVEDYQPIEKVTTDKSFIKIRPVATLEP